MTTITKVRQQVEWPSTKPVAWTQL